MAYFKLLNERSAERALRVLLNTLGAHGRLAKLGALAQDHATRNIRLELPGFDLFRPTATIKPFAWFLPKPHIGIADYFRIYEEFANRPLGLVEAPGDVAARVYPRTSVDRGLFTQFRHADQWLSPALMLAAGAQHLGAELEYRRADSVRLRLGAGLIEVTPAGCWSHNRKSVFPAEGVPFCLSNPAVMFPSTKTSNPVLRALAELCEDLDPTVLYAVTTLAHALDEDVMGRSHLNKVAKLVAPEAQRARAKGVDVEAASLALENCMEVLDVCSLDVVAELCEAAVPALMPFKRFQALFGAPSQVDDGREIKEKTRAAWRQKLNSVFNRIANNEAP